MHASYIPITNVLQKLFNLPGVFSTVKSYVDKLEKEEDIIENFIQAKLWKEKKRKHLGKFVLPLFLYFDDFEVNNVLGGHAGYKKMGVLYYSIAALPPEVIS